MKNNEIKMLIENFKKRNIQVDYLENIDEAKNKIIEMIGTGKLIGVGNSRTIKHMNIVKQLQTKGNTVYDKTNAKTKEDSKKIKKESLLTDFYITSSNAVSVDGSIVNIDHSGNRVAALLYGPENVIIVVGKNKITDSKEAAIKRVKNIAAPLNAKRAGYHPPCVELGYCNNCDSLERVCNSLVTINGQSERNHMRILIINEKLGF